MAGLILTLGLFQLESLIHTRAPFILLDVRVFPQLVASARVQACLNIAQVVLAEDLIGYLEAHQIGREMPIVLFCEDGRLSWGQAQKLDAEGYSQVYVVQDGVDGMLREADDLPV